MRGRLCSSHLCNRWQAGREQAPRAFLTALRDARAQVAGVRGDWQRKLRDRRREARHRTGEDLPCSILL